MSVILAALIDHWLGEPPARLHPVVWMGRYLGWAGHSLPSHRPLAALLLGAGYWIAGATVVGGIYWWADRAVGRLPLWAEVPLLALLLKPLFALRMLLEEVRAVEASLTEGVPAGRARLASIVSRDTSSLDAEEIRESSLESLAENLSDSVVAPLFWFALLGLPGAALYRFANTADAMWGYRGRWEWAGKFAARMDDLLNILPARLTALVLLLGRIGRLRALPEQAALTPSPNSGWPMAALALRLDVRLRKPRDYALNAAGRSPTRSDFEAAVQLVSNTAWSFVAVFSIAHEVMRDAF